MALENINCPQFVDFTTDDPFNINDGADYDFDKRIVGELDFGGKNKETTESNDLDNMFSVVSKTASTTQDLPPSSNVLSNASNLTKPLYNASNYNDAKKSEHSSTSAPSKPVDQKINKTELLDKENANSLNSIVGSASFALNGATNISQQHQKSDKQSRIATPQNSTNTKKHIRSQSNASSISNSSITQSSSTTTKKPQQLSQQTAASTNQNIVKKTLAKMTAAFKQSAKATQSSASSQSSNVNSVETLKKKLNLSKKTTQQKTMNNQPQLSSNGPFKVDHEVVMTHNPVDESSHRRCSSVPRTLKEKQALNKAGIIKEVLDDEPMTKEIVEHHESQSILPTLTSSLGDKIQSFFNSHHSNTNESSQAKPIKNIFHVSRSKQTAANKVNGNVNAPSVLAKTNNDPKKSINASKPQNELSIDLHTKNRSTSRQRSRSKDTINSNKQINTSYKANNSRSNIAMATHNSRSRNITGETFEIKQTASSINKSKQFQQKPMVNYANQSSPTSSLTQFKARQRSADRAQILLPTYSGVKFIPKHKYQQNSIETAYCSNHNILPNTLIKKDAMNLSKPLSGSNLVRSGSTNSNKPASFAVKQQYQNSIVSAISTIASTKTNPQVQITNHQSFIAATTSTSLLDANNSQLTNTSSDLNNLNNSKSKQASHGLLHTELRALKRHEYDQTLKEKERIAQLIRRNLQSEKMRKQQEEIQKIRMQRTFRSRPIKHYKPVEVKPSDKPLTEPKSPQFKSVVTSLSNLKIYSHHVSNQSNNPNIDNLHDNIDGLEMSTQAQALVDLPRQSLSGRPLGLKLASSHDDIRINY